MKNTDMQTYGRSVTTRRCWRSFRGALILISAALVFAALVVSTPDAVAANSPSDDIIDATLDAASAAFATLNT